MTVREALTRAASALAARHIPDAPLDSQVLLRHVLYMTPAQLHLQLERELTSTEWETFRSLVERRLQREPVAYLVGHQEFFGLDFYVDRRVLIPRPETELLVELTLDFAHRRSGSNPIVIADIGTGCGAIAITLAVNLPAARVYATDLSTPALEVAAMNRARHGMDHRVNLLAGNLLEPLPETADVIVANLPYVTAIEMQEAGPELAFEPALALAGGPDGLETILLLMHQAQARRPRCCLLLEIGQGQAQEVTALAAHHFPGAGIQAHRDPGGIERVVTIALPA